MQLAYRYLATSGASIIPTIQPIAEYAPINANVATDGSLKHPGTNLAIGSFGTWEWGRQFPQITPEELAYCRALEQRNVNRNGGILLAGTIAGVYCSSTRAELAGLISALAKPIPLHITLDNMGVVTRAQGLIEGKRFAHKPWQLVDDGDLWALCEQALKERGQGSTTITWTKGHASWEWLGSRAVNANSIANGQADMAADQGAEATGQAHLQTMLDFHAHKTQMYHRIVHRLQAHSAALILHDRHVREQAGIQNEGRKSPHSVLEAPAVPARACITKGVGLDLLELNPHHIPHMSDVSSVTNVHMLHIFWRAIRWDTSNTAKPTTWLELYALFRCMGGGTRDLDPFEPKPPLKQSLRAFIKASKGLIKLTGIDSSFQIFRAHRGKGFLLKDYGLLMHLPAISAEVCIPEAASKPLHNMLLTIRSIKQGMQKDKIKSSSAPLPRVEPWLNILAQAPTPLLTCMKIRCSARLNGIEQIGERGDGRDLRTSHFPLECPHCDAIKDCARIKLYAHCARGVTCHICRRSTTSTRWLCSHGVPWTSCHVHREAGFRCGLHNPANINKANFERCSKVNRPCPLKAARRLFLKAKRLGSLGEPNSSRALFNSACLSSKTKTVRKKNIKRQHGVRPPSERYTRISKPAGLQGPNSNNVSNLQYHLPLPPPLVFLFFLDFGLGLFRGGSAQPKRPGSPRTKALSSARAIAQQFGQYNSIAQTAMARAMM